IVSSLSNLIIGTSKPKNIGAIVTHTGFALFLMGTLLTFSNSKIISMNTSGHDLGTAKANEESLVLYKNDTVFMNGYHVVYTNRFPKGSTTEFEVDFLKRSEAGLYTKEFTLFPSVNVHERMGAVYNPDTRHLVTRDYYMYISHVSDDPDFIVITAIMNPYIVILWTGAVIMIAGFAYSYWRRVRKKIVLSRAE
ncbi:MAG: hypothetical protein WCL00_01520, partial [Bacteroidota bacterium]